MIITLSGAKGGTGKSTLAVHRAAEWAARGRRVLLVDSDPQGTVIGSLMRRTAIGESTTAGEGITEREPKGAGALEMRALLEAIELFMSGKGTVDVA